MNSWVKQWSSDSNRRTPKSVGKGKSKGGQPPDAKRMKTEDAPKGSRVLKQLVENSAELGLQNARLLRTLFGMGVVTSLVPDCAAVREAAAVPLETANPMLSDANRWGALAMNLANESKVSQEDRNILTEHVNTISAPEQLLGCVLMCQCQSTFGDDKLYRVQIKVSSSLERVAAALLRALISMGAESKYGAPPRSSAERLTASSLKLYKQL
jgi:hypothetical protein